VRAWRQYPDQSFVDNEDGTVTDNATGLMWQQGEQGYMIWEQALNYCEGLNLANKTDWRLPNIKELESITDDTKYNPAIDRAFFPNAYASDYWSSTTFAYGPYGAWGVGFYGGHVSSTDKYYYSYVRCVRGGESGSLGNLDHFEFSFISSPQSVGVPFNVTITARDVNNTLLNWSGQVQLSSSAGGNSVSPTNVPLVNGQWNGEVRLNSAGNNMFLTAGIIGISGRSNAFNVAGATSNFGKLAGDIRSNGHLMTGSVTVVVSNNSNYYDKTITGGIYDFTDIPIACGVYDVYAVRNDTGVQSRTYKDVNIPCGQSATRDIVIPSCVSNNKVPVILIPGIMGSAQANQRTSMFPGLPKGSPEWDSNRLEIHVPRIAGWKKLKDKLNDAGYDECTIYEVPFDWRMDINESWCKYLKPWIEEAKNKTGQPNVDVIAHSMGGLLTRAYIQSDPDEDRKLPECRNGYENDIRKFAMVGTPNKGSAKAYYLWEGADPKLLDDIVSLGSGWGNFYWNVTEKNYSIAHDGKDIDYDDYDEIWNYFTGGQPKGADAGLKGLMQLLPTYPFLEVQGASQPQELNEVKNDFLIKLNSSPKKNRMGKSGSGKIETKVFLGFGGDTIRNVKVQKTGGQKRYRDGWIRDEEKSAVFDQNDAGDSTVLLESARFPAEDGWANEYTLGGCDDHKSLIKCYAESGSLIAFLTGTQTYTRRDVQMLSIEPSDRTLSVHIQGRVKPYLVAPTGQASGIHYVTSARENAIPSTIVQIDSDASGIIVENPPDGAYTLYLSNIYDEDFTLGLSYIDPEGGNEIEHRSFNHSGTMTVTLTLNAGTAEKITVVYSPLIPAGLQADAVSSVGLKTRLTWDLSTDPNVAHYNIYSKYVDEPYLSQLGTTTGNSYDTEHLWAENSTIKTRIYEVSAVKNDGTESFLSVMVQNNDRDHDGLTDEQEVAYGTNVSNPDSDGDGLKDGEEYARETNPLAIDTNGDGYSDYVEVQAGSDPLDINSIPPCATPDAPNLISPPDDAPGVSTTPALDWNDVSGATSYNVQVCSGSNCSSVVKSLNVTNSQRTISSALNLGTTYYWRVRAKNSCGYSSWSNVWSFTTYFVKPPSQLSAKAISSTQIVLNWIDNSDNELGFKIERKEGACDSANTWKQIAKKGANVTTHTNTGLTPNTTYSYQVRAYNADDNSAYSNCASAKTALSGTSKAPSNLKATSVSSSKVNLLWKDNSLDETSFKVYRKVGTGSWTLLTTTDVDTVSYSDTTAGGNTSTTSYSYYVKACNSSGCSPATSIAVVPYSPMNLVVEAYAGKVDLTWEDESSNETGFQIYRKSGNCSSTNSWSVIETTGGNITSYSNTGLSSGTTYSYKVRAYKKSSAQPYAYGYSLFSNCSSATTP